MNRTHRILENTPRNFSSPKCEFLLLKIKVHLLLLSLVFWLPYHANCVSVRRRARIWLFSSLKLRFSFPVCREQWEEFSIVLDTFRQRRKLSSSSTSCIALSLLNVIILDSQHPWAKTMYRTRSRSGRSFRGMTWTQIRKQFQLVGSEEPGKGGGGGGKAGGDCTLFK